MCNIKSRENGCSYASAKALYIRTYFHVNISLNTHGIAEGNSYKTKHTPGTVQFSMSLLMLIMEAVPRHTIY